MKKLLLFLTIVLMGVGAMAQTTYTKITSESALSAGDKVLLVGIDDEGQAWAMSYQKTNNRKAIAVDMIGDEIIATVATDPSNQTDPFEITIGGGVGEWTFFDELNNGYLYAPGGGNYLKTQANLDDKGKWTLPMDGEGFAPTSNGGVEQCIMRYNPNATNNDPLFGCYKSSSNVTGLVYVFKAGGTTINPEPSNYPTNVWAEVQGTDVTIHWIDATGNQLPSKYLVVGAMGNISVPVDGNPVPDGELAKNVNYGVQQVAFSGLDGNTTYHFAIFPYTNGGTNIDYKTDGNYPTVHVTTEAVFTLLDEDFNNDLGSFTAYSVLGDQEWHQASYNGVTYANMNGYASGAAHANEDWLISPEIPFNRMFDAYVLEFSTAMKFDGNPLLVKVSSDFNGGEPSDGYWVDITDNFNFSTGDYTWVESGRYDLTDDLTNQLGFFHIAFVYICDDAAASSWEIDYVKVTGENGVSVDENAATTVSVYPNPARDVVSFNLESDAQVSVIDITGRVVSTMNMAAGQGQCQVSNLENGVYFLNIRYADGKKEVARFVKF